MLIAAAGVAVLSISYWGFRTARMEQLDAYESCTLYLVLVVYVMSNLLPILSLPFLNTTLDVEVEVWALGTIVEAGFLATALVGWRLARGYRPRIMTLIGSKRDATWMSLILFLVVIGAVVIIVGSPAWRLWGYETASWRITKAPSIEEFSIGGPVRLIQRIAATGIFIIGAREGLKSPLGRIAWIMSGLILVLNIISGSRGAVFADVTAITVALVLIGRLRLRIVMPLAVLALVPVFVYMRGYRTELWGQGVLDTRARGEILYEYLSSAAPPISENLRNLILRQDNFHDSGLLVEYTIITGEFALLDPYEGSFLAWLPRYVWPRKPIPGSISTDYSGTPWYIASRLRGMPGNSVGVGPGGIAFWQFGLIGVLTIGLLVGAQLRVICRICRATGMLGMLLFLVYARETHFMMVAGGDSIVRIWFQILVPLFLAALLYGVIRETILRATRRPRSRAISWAHE